jgi:hypothetical protein
MALDPCITGRAKETDKNAGARGIGKSGVAMNNPTLTELGLTKDPTSGRKG